MIPFRGTSSAADRAERLNRFAADWTGLPLELAPRLELPVALAELYAFRSLVPRLSVQDRLLDPCRIEGDRVSFVEENQSVWTASTSRRGEDPPVVFDDPEFAPIERVSEFVTTFVLAELTFGSPWTVSDEVLDTVFEADTSEVLWEGRHAWSLARVRSWRGALVFEPLGEQSPARFYGARDPDTASGLLARSSPITGLSASPVPGWSVEVRSTGVCRVWRPSLGSVPAVHEVPSNAHLASWLQEAITAAGTDEVGARAVEFLRSGFVRGPPRTLPSTMVVAVTRVLLADHAWASDFEEAMGRVTTADSV